MGTSPDGETNQGGTYYLNFLRGHCSWGETTYPYFPILYHHNLHGQLFRFLTSYNSSNHLFQKNWKYINRVYYNGIFFVYFNYNRKFCIQEKQHHLVIVLGWQQATSTVPTNYCSVAVRNGKKVQGKKLVLGIGYVWSKENSIVYRWSELLPTACKVRTFWEAHIIWKNLLVVLTFTK